MFQTQHLAGIGVCCIRHCACHFLFLQGLAIRLPFLYSYPITLSTLWQKNKDTKDCESRKADRQSAVFVEYRLSTQDDPGAMADSTSAAGGIEGEFRNLRGIRHR